MSAPDIRTNSSAPALVGDHYISVVETYQVIPSFLGPFPVDDELRTMYYEICVDSELDGESILSLKITREEAFELAELLLHAGRQMG